MKLILIRRAKAVAPESWHGEADLRPLAPLGREQAGSLAERLRGEGVTRIVSSPALRCQQTVEPLAQAAGLPVEVDAGLAEAEDAVQSALELLPAHGDGALVLCTHRRLIVSLLRLFELPEAADPRIPCQKGSAWILEGTGQVFGQARYLEPARRSAVSGSGSAPGNVRAATLDLGSTSFNLLIADVAPDGEIRPMVREKVMLRLGALIASHGSIPEDVCERAVEVARTLRDVAEQEKVQRLFPVATSAIRDAGNGRQLAGRIGRALGTPVRVLSGEEEARLIFRAFQRRVPIGAETVLGVDLGGGSLELALGSERGIAWEATLPLGVARIHRELVERDLLGGAEAKRIRERVREQLAPRLPELRARPFARAVATGGTVRALARLLREKGRSRPAGPEVVSLERLERLTRELGRASLGERLAMRGMRKDRADLLPAGGLILCTLAEELGIDSLAISDWGLREGVLLDALLGAASR